MEWHFLINTGKSILNFHAEVIFQTHVTQTIRVTVQDRTLVVENDFPYILSMKLKRKITWRRIAGKVGNVDVYLEVIDNLEDYVRKNSPRPR